MSDVERIVNANHERVRWAAECEGERIATPPAEARNDKHGRQVYRSTALGCAMFTGGASAFVGIGLSMGRWLTVAIGLMVAVLFLACGSWAERLAEEDDA